MAGLRAAFLAGFLATAFLALFGAAFLVVALLVALVAFFGAALFAIIGKDRLVMCSSSLIFYTSLSQSSFGAKTITENLDD